MRFETYGDPKNPVILFLHGGGVGGWMWEEQIQYFQTNYYLLVPELPLSNPHFKINETALQLEQKLDESIINKKIILVGFSIGAQITIAMIGNSPNKYVAAMINSALTIPIQNRLMEFILEYSYPLTKSRFFAKLQASSMGVPKEHFNTYYEESLNYSKEAFLNMMKENMTFNVPNSFYNTVIPTLFTIGSKEQKIVKKSFEQLTKTSSNASKYIFDKVAHNAPFKAATEFNRILDKLLKEVLSNE